MSVLERRRLRPRRGVRVLPRPREDAARGRRGRGRGRGHARQPRALRAALLDEAEAARLAIERANDALDEAARRGEAGRARRRRRRRGSGGDARFERGRQIGRATLAGALADSSATATYKRTTRAELRLELKRVGGFLKRVRKGAQEKPDVAEYLTRALVFQNRRAEGPSGGGGTGQTDDAETDVDTLVTALHERLCDAFGLERACAVSARVTAAAAKRASARRGGDDGRVDFAALFARDASRRGPCLTVPTSRAFLTRPRRRLRRRKRKLRRTRRTRRTRKTRALTNSGYLSALRLGR